MVDLRSPICTVLAENFRFISAVSKLVSHPSQELCQVGTMALGNLSSLSQQARKEIMSHSFVIHNLIKLFNPQTNEALYYEVELSFS